MKNKKAFGILALVLFLFMFSSRVIFTSFSSIFAPKTKIEVESVEDKRFKKFKQAMLSSTYFKDSSIILSDDKSKATIDGKYDVLIKNGTYIMRIIDNNMEREYCQIVDAVEQSFGMDAEESIVTCMETLNGSVNIGGISVEFYDTHKVLSVKSDEKALLYDITKYHENGDLISVNEINYNIMIGNYLFTSMSTKFDSNNKIYDLCGHVYNRDKVTDDFVLKIYDDGREIIEEKQFNYENNSNKYLSFCVDYHIEKDTVRYYSVERIGE